MAWYKRYRVPFESLDGTQYMVYIYEQTNGSVTDLTGASDPFVTSEDDDDDIFTPIRRQTGYLRLIDETQGGDLLNTLMPANNTEKLVRLYTGIWSADYATFTDGDIKWQGFLCAEAFTQPWDGQKKVLEFPVKSLLAVLEDIQIPEGSASSELRFARLVEQAFTTVGVLPETVNIITNLTVDQRDMLGVFLQYQIFFSEETINNGGDSYQQLVGMSYFEALAGAARLFGACLREDATNLNIVLYDKNGGRLFKEALDWVQFSDIGQNGSVYIVTRTELTDVDMLQALTFRGSDNVAAYLQGGRSAKVVLSVEDSLSLHISLPQTTEDDSTVYEIEDVTNGQAFVQPHQPRVNSIEAYSFYEYVTTGYQPEVSNPLYNFVGVSNYSNCLNNSVIFRPLFDPLYSANDHLHTGAFPCRWCFKKNVTDSQLLKNGLFLNQMYLKANAQPANYCYSIGSALSYNLVNGYLNIDMKCYNFQRGLSAQGYTLDELVFGEYNTPWGGKPQTRLHFRLTWGNKEWTGTEWVTISSNISTFYIDFDGASVKTNKTETMQVDGNSGWFIPVEEELEGKIKLYILNISRCDINRTVDTLFADNHSKIIFDLAVEFKPIMDMAVSGRGQNTYRQTIMQSGFSTDKGIDLFVGTINNNIVTPSFIKRDLSTFIETLQYYTATSSKDQRPELNLLSRMVSLYSEVRRTFRATVQSGIDLMLARYTYNSRKYFAVDAEHHWRDDEEEVKFIEVT